MLMSRLFGARYREAPADAVLQSHIFLLKGGYVRPAANGIFSLLPPGRRIAQNIEALLRQEMDALGGQEVLFPVVLPASLWEESGRYETVGQELVRFSDRAGRRLVLGMTHEEAAVQMVRDVSPSFGQYPFLLYQIQTKFRDEPRPRGGLLRTREFTMKDAYSFHTSHEDLAEFYGRVHEAYLRIFRRAGLRRVAAVDSDTGMMGGGQAHEFMYLHDSGEDTLFFCPSCGYRANAEVLGEGAEACPRCGAGLEHSRGIELGHIFQLGGKYAESMGLAYVDRDGRRKTPRMGCYGIGVGRLMACALEEHCGERGPVWPVELAPWQVHVCALGKAALPAARELAERLEACSTVLLDDRDLSAGVQFADADLLGAPLRVVVSGRTLAEGKAELEVRGEGRRELAALEDVPGAVSRLLTGLRQRAVQPD